jgi:hypothetical protein
VLVRLAYAAKGSLVAHVMKSPRDRREAAGWPLPAGASCEAERRPRARRLLGYASVLALACVIRWQIMLTCYRLPDSDQVIVGLMARHIIAGERPIFYWGQSYNGTLDAYITALLFRLVGASYEAMHVAPIAFSVLFVAATMHIARFLYGRSIALLSGLALACGPALLLHYSIEPGYNYLEAMALATLALSLLLPLGASGGWWRLPAASSLLGLALWAQPLALVYVPSLLLVVRGPVVDAWGRANERRLLLGAILIAVTLLGLALWPAIVFNTHADGASLNFLLSQPSHLPISLPEKLRRLALWGSPVLLGLYPPSTVPDRVVRALHRYPFVDPAVLVLLSLCVLTLLASRRPLSFRARSTGVRCSVGGASLLVVALVATGSYLCSSWSSSSWSATDPRYLLPLYTLTPLLLRGLLPRTSPRWGRWAGGIAIALALTWGISVNLSAPPVVSLSSLAGLLEQQGTQVVYGNYWDVYRLAFVSDERLVPVVATPGMGLGLNRYPAYLQRAARATVGAWIVLPHSRAEWALRTCLQRRHLAYQHVVYLDGDRLAVYDRLSSPALCLGPMTLHEATAIHRRYSFTGRR